MSSAVTIYGVLMTYGEIVCVYAHVCDYVNKERDLPVCMSPPGMLPMVKFMTRI